MSWSVDANQIQSGPGVIEIEWPRSAQAGSSAVTDFLEATVRGETPAAPYPILGELFSFVARIEAGTARG